MPLIKTAFGLLEEDNFLLSSPASDFLGSGAWSRSSNLFHLKSGSVLRRIPYDSFLIDIKIDSDLSSADFVFFIQSDNTRYGISADSSSCSDFRLVFFDRFLQAFASFDSGLSWENIGGCPLDPSGELLQGFELTSPGGLFISAYSVFRSPYFTVQGFIPGTPAKLVSDDGLSLYRFFDDDFQCRFFLDRPRRCSFQTLAPDDGSVLFSSDFLDLSPGDSFLFSTESIELIHNDKPLDFTTVNLQGSLESFFLKNTASEPVSDINIAVINHSPDSIELSFDQNSWSNSLFLPSLMPNDPIPFFLRIFHNEPHFCVRNFEIYIY